jgi:hypothetical protein
MPWKSISIEAGRQYDRDYYAAYGLDKKKALLQQKTDRRREIAAKILQYKLTLKCACGESHPACFDFHHTSDDKEIHVGGAIQRGWSFERIMKEIKKCVVLCSNCHRKHHFSERSSGT